MEIYKHVLNMLDYLYMEQNQHTSSQLPYNNDNNYKANQSILVDGMDQSKLGSIVSNII